MKTTYLALLILICLPRALFAQTVTEVPDKIDVNLNCLLEIPHCWELTEEQIDKLYDSGDNGVMEWVTADKTRATFSRNRYGNVEINLTLLEGTLPIEEAIIDFVDGELDVITLSIFNRGDAGEISHSRFKELHKLTGKSLSEQLKVKPQFRKANRQQGLLFEGYRWKSAHTIAALEYNEGVNSGSNVEFLRLRIARKGSKSALAKAMLSERGGASVRLSDLTQAVEKNQKGDIYIKKLPMVDQGSKGYCVVATVQRLFEYYGIGADMHQLAYVAGSDPKRGTSTFQMAEEIGAIDFRFKTRMSIIGMSTEKGELVKVGRDFEVGRKVDERKYLKTIRSHIDDGIPLLWSLKLGDYPEVPNLRPQTSGYHMRMIIGYNDKTQTIIFSDSWGAGHEFKTMKMRDSYLATTGLFVLKPTVR